jgi:tellurite resistance protein
MALLFYRAAFGPPLPEPLRPSWFILLVPPSLIYANGLLLYESAFFLENLYFFGLVLALALLLSAKDLFKWKFGPPWWAFTFPLDALAYAAARYAQDHPSTPATVAAAATLALATVFVLTVLWKTLAGAASPH